MRRHLFNLLTAFSLLLMVAIVALWIRSRSVTEYLQADFTWNSSSFWRGEGLGIESWQGHTGLCLDYHHSILASPAPSKPFRIHYLQPAFFAGVSWSPEFTTWNWFGFYRATDKYPIISGSKRPVPPMDQDWTERYGMPDWFLAAIFSILPARWLITAIRRRRTPGLCPTCHYDLRASKDRCPECGTPIPSRSAEKSRTSPSHPT